MSRLVDTLRLVLVGLLWHRPFDPRTPLGQASIEAALRAGTGLDVVSHSVPVEGARAADIAARLLADVGPRTDIAFGGYVWNEALLHQVMAELRRAGFAGRIVLGGPQVSYAGDGLELLYPEVDVFVRGYGERAMCELYRGARPSAIRGVHVAGQLDQRTVAEAPLDELPSPYLTGTLPLVFEPGAPRRFVRWETQRGCKYRCSFCQHREAGARLTRSAFNMDRVEAEIAAFVEAGVDDIAVLDPVFNSGQHAHDVLALLRAAGYAGRISLQCHFEKLDAPFLDALDGLDATLELGLQTIHLSEGRAVSRFNKRENVEVGLAELRARGIDHEVSIIFGLPTQTLSSFRETVDWCLRRQIPRLKAFPLMLLRGTPLEAQRSRWALVENEDPIPAVVASTTFDRADHAAMARIAAALKETEGAHPLTVAELADVHADLPTWSPRSAS